jgi:TP901 family phage tail tape measure protein
MANNFLEIEVLLGQATQKLNELKESATNAGNTIKGAAQTGGEGMGKMNDVIMSTTRSYDNLTKQTKRLYDEEIRLEKAVAKSRKPEATARYRQQLELVRQQIKLAEAGVKKFGQTGTVAMNRMRIQGTGLLGVFNKLGAVLGISFGLYGAFRIMTNTIKSIAEFELAMKKLESITNASTYQMQRFSSVALEVGRNSIYGAKGVAEMMTQLAKMGFAARTIEDMTQGIVNLATATQEDLGKTTETVANVIRAWGLTGRDTTRVVDAMGKAFVSSALDMERFRQSIKYIAPIARTANFNLEETSALLGVLADRGLYGSLAGTSLRNVLFRMADANGALAKRTGVTVRSFDDFIESLRVLNKEGLNITDVLGLMDRRASSAFDALIKQPEALDQLQRSIRASAGEAQRMADVQMESLTYKTRRMTEAWKALVLEMDEGSSLMSRVLKTVVDAFTREFNRISGSIATTEADMLRQQANTVEQLINTVQRYGDTTEIGRTALESLIRLHPEFFSELRESGDIVRDLSTAWDEYNVNMDRAIRLSEFEQRKKDIEAYSEAAKKSLAELAVAGNDLEEGLVRIDRNKMIAFRTESIQGYEKEMKNLNLEMEKFIEANFSIAERIEMADVSDVVKGWEESVVSAANAFNREGVSASESWATAMNNVYDELQLQIDSYQEGSYEALKLSKVYLELQERLRELGVLWKESTSENATLLKLQQRQAELQARLSLEGVELEKRLADIKADYGRRIAEIQISDSEELKQTLVNINEERRLDFLNIANKEIQDNLKKTQEIFKQEQELIRLKESLRVAEIENRFFGTNREEQLLNLRYANEKKRINDEYETAVYAARERAKTSRELAEKLNDDLERLSNERNVKLQIANQKFANDERAIYEQNLETFIEFENIKAELAKTRGETELEIARLKFFAEKRSQKEITDFEEQQRQERLRLEVAFTQEMIELARTRMAETQDVDEIERLNAEIERLTLTLEKLGVELDNPAFDMQRMSQNLRMAINTITRPLNDLANAWASTTDKIVSEIERQLTTAQNALQTELKLAEQGYANNVSLKQKEIADLEKMRAKAIREQEQAAKTQLHIDSLTQASNLITAATQIFKEGSKFGLAGVLLSIGAVATIFSQMQKYKLQAREFSVKKYERGGYQVLGGERHSRGGTSLGVLGEAEKGEGVGILSRRATGKYGGMFKEFVEAANRNKLDKSLLPQFGNINVSASVNMDDSKELITIRKALTKRGGQTVEYGNGYRIVRRGGVTERYWEN